MKRFNLMVLSAFVLLTAKAQWIHLPAPSSHNSKSIYFLDNNLGYSVGYSGGVIKTTNGGLNWSSTTGGTSSALVSVFFTDPNTGYTAAEDSKLRKTTDGGATWSQILSYPTAYYSHVLFTDANNGYLTGSDYVRKTTDAGITWTSHFVNGSYVGSAIDFVDPNIGYAVGSHIAKTTNAGGTWVVQSSTSFFFNDVCFIDQNNGYAVGGNLVGLPDTSMIYKTTNGGTNWNLMYSGIECFKSVGFSSIDTGYVTGTYGTILKTVDGGNSWIEQTSGTTLPLNAIQVLNTNKIYISGSSGTVLTTTNYEQANPFTISAVQTGSDVNLTWTDPGMPVNYYSVYDGGILIGTISNSFSYLQIKPCPRQHFYKVIAHNTSNNTYYTSNTDSISIAGGLIRNAVLVEGGTYESCIHCPSSAMGIRDMIETYDLNVIAIEYHSSASPVIFQSQASLDRINYYGITGFPTMFFDGVESYSGGGYNTTNYPYYAPLYNKRIVVPGWHSIDVGIVMDSLDHYTATLITTQNDDCEQGWKLRTALTESNIPDIWYNQTEMDHVCRGMFPSAAGTLLDFSLNNSDTVTVQFTTAGLVKDNCRFIAFVQNDPTKEVSATIQIDMSGNFGLETTASPEIHIYPNPFTSSITIDGIEQPTVVKLYNMTGEEIGIWDLHLGYNTISMEGLKPGMYFLHFSIDDQWISKKIIKN